jgi:hypothetical protein
MLGKLAPSSSVEVVEELEDSMGTENGNVYDYTHVLRLNDDDDRHDRHDHLHCDHYEYHFAPKKINPPVFCSSQEDRGAFSFPGPGHAYVLSKCCYRRWS